MQNSNRKNTDKHRLTDTDWSTLHTFRKFRGGFVFKDYFKNYYCLLLLFEEISGGRGGKDGRIEEEERMAVIRWRVERGGAHASKVVSSEWFEGVEGRR